MNERIEALIALARNRASYLYAVADRQGDYEDLYNRTLIELTVQECTQLLFDESERLYAYASECDNLRDSDEAEACAEKCTDNIVMIDQHFGVDK